MNHKRGRPKNSRSGCLLCKRHKANGVNIEKPSIQRRIQVGKLEFRLQVLTKNGEESFFQYPKHLTETKKYG